MTRRPIGWLLVFLAAAWPATAAAGSPYLHVQRQDARGVVLDVRIPAEAVAQDVDPDGRRRVRVRGLGMTREPGRPELPVVVGTLAIPEGAKLRVSWSVGSETAQRGTAVRPAPTLDPRTRDVRRVPDRDFYDGNGVWPDRRVVVEEVRFRGVRLARLTIHPFRYDPAARELLFTPAIDIDVAFDGGTGVRTEGGPLGAAEQRVLSATLNATSIGPRDAPRPAGRSHVKSGIPTAPGVKIRVGTAGLIRVTQEDLDAVGLPVAGIDPRELEMSYRGSPLPCRVIGEADGSFDPGDAVEFYGVPGSGRFSEDNVYWLSDTGAPGLRFPTRDAAPGDAPVAVTFPHTERYEEGNSIYDFGTDVVEGDPHFFWAWFDGTNGFPPRITKLTHVATLPGVDPGGPQATLRAFFSGQTDPVENPDHRVRFLVNDTEVGETTWNGLAFHTAEIDFDPGLLEEGDNTFEIELVSIAVIDSYYLDWFEVSYPREPQAIDGALAIRGEGPGATRYDVAGFGSATDPVVLDVTDPFAPVELTGVEVVPGGTSTLRFEDVPAGRSYFAADDDGRIAPAGLTLDTPSTLRDPSNGADLLIVVPDGWESALAPLAAWRTGQGLRVVVAALTDVADEFAGGNVDDLAVRELVRYAFTSWQPPAPSYLLLVGEPNLDPLNYLGRPVFDHWMPTHFGVTGPLGETMTDHWFGAVAGDDPVPDVSVGRISVRSPAAAADVVAKILAYEGAADDGAAWRSNVIRVASTSPLFEDALERASEELPAHFSLNTQYRLAGASTFSIQTAIDAGALVVSFLGHGNVATWADVPGGSFFTAASAGALTNADRLPFVTALNCLNGLVGHPTQRDSLAELLVNAPDTGAVATLSPAGLGFLSEFDLLQTELYRALFQDHVPQAGLASTESLVRTFLDHAVDVDLITKMLFTGDPATVLAIDADDDGLLDFAETQNGLDPGDRDSDDDGLTDGEEGPAASDSDGDGVPNALDPDADNDALPDGLEAGLVDPDADTDLARGRFVPDADPSSTTDPFDPDSDGGGAPDGIEDLDADGLVDSGETDPEVPADDPVCSTATPPELGVDPADLLTLLRTGDETLLTWGDAAESCVLYRVYRAGDSNGVDGAAAFELLRVTAGTSLVDAEPAASGTLQLYLVTGSTLVGGEGPWGHFDR